MFLISLLSTGTSGAFSVEFFIIQSVLRQCKGLVLVQLQGVSPYLMQTFTFILVQFSKFPFGPFLCFLWPSERQACSYMYQPHPSLVTSANFVRAQPLMNTLNGMNSRQIPEKFPLTGFQVEYDSVTITLCAQKTQSFHPSSSPAIQTIAFQTAYKGDVTNNKG